MQRISINTNGILKFFIQRYFSIYSPVRGMKDILSDECDLQTHIINTMTKYAELSNFKRIDTPVVERASLFYKTVGENTDITSKEMYEFLDKSGESICLRPEFTASINRALLDQGFQFHLPKQFYYCGPVFRYERPQKGRYRQFTQFGGEYIGGEDPYIDLFVLSLLYNTLRALNVDNEITLHINSLGDKESMKNYYILLKSYFENQKMNLSKQSQDRLARGSVLRILDSKEEEDTSIIKNAPAIHSCYNSYSKQYFDTICNELNQAHIPFVVTPTLVRGLDYYQHTTFEFIDKRNITAGGRYDLSLTLNSSVSLPSIGWSAGVERIALLLEEKYKPKFKYPTLMYECSKDSDSTILKRKQINLYNYLTQNNIQVQMFFNQNLKKNMKKLNGKEINYCIFIDENQDSSVQIKNLSTREQVRIKEKELLSFIKSIS